MPFHLDAAAAQIAAHFGAVAGSDPWRGGHVAPGQFAPIITAGREAIAGPRAERQPRRMVPPPAARGARQGVLSVRNLDSRSGSATCATASSAVWFPPPALWNGAGSPHQNPAERG